MKAIEINGEIKTFGSVPKRWSDENGLHLNIGDGSAFGFKDVVTPTYDVIDLPITETLSKLKSNKINQLKALVGFELSKTDWYIIREADSGESTPTNVRGERAALRTKSDSIEAEINALTTKKAVVLFDINI